MLNLKVEHKKYGAGVVVNVDENTSRLTIQFSDKINKVFKYPESFVKNVVSFCDKDMQYEAVAADNALKNTKHQENLDYLDSLSKKFSIDANGSPNFEGGAVTIQPGCELHTNDHFSESAQKIYKAGVTAFGWDPAKTGVFAQQKALCALNVTPRGEAVWMMANSNWNGNSNKSQENYISEDRKTIREVWKITIPQEEIPVQTRIIFAKNKQGKYVFLGVYNCEFDLSTNTRICKLISSTYKG